jgi:hypothetical protein
MMEAVFRDGKTSGWPWEARQVRDPQHQVVLVLVLAIMTLLTRCLGKGAAQAIMTLLTRCLGEEAAQG